MIISSNYLNAHSYQRKIPDLSVDLNDRAGANRDAMPYYEAMGRTNDRSTPCPQPHTKCDVLVDS